MKPKVLLVDDEPDTLTLLDYALCAEGFDVTTAATGMDALRKARCNPPDVVLLDIKLPDVDGFVVCELLHAQPPNAQTPVILFSSHSGFSIQARGVEVGSVRCMKKSEGLDEVVRWLRLALEESKAGRGFTRSKLERSPLSEPRKER